MMQNAEPGGVVVPVITPVDSKERIDEAAFRKGLRRLIGAGVHAIFGGGSAGERPLLKAVEWERMVRIAHFIVGDSNHALARRCDRYLDKVSPRKDPHPIAAQVSILRGNSYLLHHAPSELVPEHHENHTRIGITQKRKASTPRSSAIC